MLGSKQKMIEKEDAAYLEKPWRHGRMPRTISTMSRIRI